MSRPRILLVPTLTELEWTIRPLLEEWAEVASFDGPGVGDAPPSDGTRSEGTARRGVALVDELGWDRYVVVGDELGSLAALLVAQARPGAVRGIALGHPLVSVDTSGERRPFNVAVVEAHYQLAEASHRAFVRDQFRAWMGLRGEPTHDADALAEAFLLRVPHEVATSFYSDVLENGRRYEIAVRSALDELMDKPMLLVHHEGCIMFTPEGFEDAVAALPDAATAATFNKPSVDPAFDGILRGFVEQLPG